MSGAPIQPKILSAQCKALGDPVRLKIMCILPKSPNCEHRNNVSQLSEILGLTQPTVSHHLKILKQAGLIDSKKMCRDVFYWLDEAGTTTLIESLERAMNLNGPVQKKTGIESEKKAVSQPGGSG